MTFSDVFFVFFRARKMGTSVYALCILRLCDVAITPLNLPVPGQLVACDRVRELAKSTLRGY